MFLNGNIFDASPSSHLQRKLLAVNVYMSFIKSTLHLRDIKTGDSLNEQNSFIPLPSIKKNRGEGGGQK